MKTGVNFCRKLPLAEIDRVCMTAKPIGSFVDVDIVICFVQGPQGANSSRAAADDSNLFPEETIRISRGIHCTRVCHDEKYVESV